MSEINPNWSDWHQAKTKERIEEKNAKELNAADLDNIAEDLKRIEVRRFALKVLLRDRRISQVEAAQHVEDLALGVEDLRDSFDRVLTELSGKVGIVYQVPEEGR